MSRIAAAFVIPGDLGLPTGGYAYDRHVLARAAGHGVDLTHVALPGRYPAPTPDALAATARALAALPNDTVLLIDGLAYGAMPHDVVGRIRQRIVALVHHPLCLETGLSPQRQAALRASEQAALQVARAVVTTSVETGRILVHDFGVSPEHLTIAEPGTTRAARATGTGNPLALLAVGSLVPRKAYGVLLDALSALNGVPPWHLTIIGAARDDLEAARIMERARDPRMRDRVTLITDADDAAVAAHYAAADLFVLPSAYEGYGMVLTEALVRGLPIVTTTGVAAAMPLAHAVSIVEPGDAAALRAALQSLMIDAHARQTLADAAWAEAQRLPTWDDTTRTIAQVLQRVAA